MQIFPLGRVYDFMGQRRIFMVLSFASALAALVAIFKPGLNFGTDFRGGTEIEVAFNAPVDTAAVRHAVTASGFHAPDVMKVDDTKTPNHYMIRVQEVSTIAPEKQAEIERTLCPGEGLPEAECPLG